MYLLPFSVLCQHIFSKGDYTWYSHLLYELPVEKKNTELFSSIGEVLQENTRIPSLPTKTVTIRAYDQQNLMSFFLDIQ